MATEEADAGTEGGETADGGSDHFRSVTVTGIAALAGVLAALVSATITAGMPPAEAARDGTAQAVVLATIGLEPVVMGLLGLIDIDDFGAKDYLFVAFMTFSMWFITWGILLTTGVEL